MFNMVGIDIFYTILTYLFFLINVYIFSNIRIRIFSIRNFADADVNVYADAPRMRVFDISLLEIHEKRPIFLNVAPEARYAAKG